MRRAPDGGVSRVLANATGRLLEPGHSVDRIRNGSVFDVMEEEIRRAQRSIHLEMDVWKPGRASDRVVRALAERRRAGVRVRIVVDRWGSRGGFVDHVQPQLEAIGCDVKLFNPAGRLSTSRTFAQTRRKLMVVDGAVALVGGWCIWDNFLGNGVGTGHWRDTNVRIRGPAVRFTQAAFLESWQQAGGALPPIDDLPWPQNAPADVSAAFVRSSVTHSGTTQAHALVHALLPTARSRLWLSVGYFAPPEDVVSLLCNRARAGVDVRVLVPGPVHDAPTTREAGRALYRTLLDAGVRLFEYQPSMMHAKTAVVDDGVAVVGSMHLEPGARHRLEEGAAIFWSPDLNATLARDFQEDLAEADEVNAESLPTPSLRPARRALRWASGVVTDWIRRGRRSESGAGVSSSG